jgi:hypothetical protein
LLHRYSNRLECNEQSNTGAEKPQPAVIWLVDDVAANAAVIIVIATEHLLGPVNIRHGCISTLSNAYSQGKFIFIHLLKKEFTH